MTKPQKVDLKPGDPIDMDLDAILDRIAHWLPSQAPLKDFIHHNTLHHLVEYPFFEALERASIVYGSKTTLSDSEWKELYLARKLSPPHFTSAATKSPGFVKDGIRRRLRHGTGVDTRYTIQALVFRMLGTYLDQGISSWPMPASNEAHHQNGFYEAVRSLENDSIFPLTWMSRKRSKEVHALFKLSPAQAIHQVLENLSIPLQLRERFLTELHLEHPGWSGMVYQLESGQSRLDIHRPISLLGLTAVQLVLEYSQYSDSALKRLKTIHLKAHHNIRNLAELPTLSPSERALAWQVPYEKNLYQPFISELKTRLESRASRQFPKPNFQAIFCVDDRECSLRRHLEAVGKERGHLIDTYGYAGFFGIEFLFVRRGQTGAVKQCPAPVQTNKRLHAKAIENNGQEGSTHRLSLEKLTFKRENHAFLNTYLMSNTFGFWAALKLAYRVFFPSFHATDVAALTYVDPTDDLDPREDFSTEELATRVFQVLTAIGLTKDFSDDIFIVGHGSSSSNNPYYTAYDCGACSGHPGSPNSRAFSHAANDPEVRAHLKGLGVNIPDSTLFHAAIHDTCRDEVKFLSKSPAMFSECIEEALERNAQERIKAFSLTTYPPNQARDEVRTRSSAIFEVRPEYNHATNALTVIAPRSLTVGVDLKRRAFLQSYVPESDPNGTILAGLLKALIPVCGGINLEYFFSRIDPEVYGAGSKLPHNIVGLIGVAAGVHNDLRTGLPVQMTEIHDPVRSLFLINQKREVIDLAFGQIQDAFLWVRNEWIIAASLSEEGLYYYKDGWIKQ
jgi:uncharacterized protein